MKGIAAVGGAENGSATRQNAGNLFDREFERFFRPDEAVEAIGDADDLPSVLKDGSFGGGANDRVEAGSVSASGGDTDAANVRHRIENRRSSLVPSQGSGQAKNSRWSNLNWIDRLYDNTLSLEDGNLRVGVGGDCD